MDTRLLAIDSQMPDANVLLDAATILRSGGLVAFPTETVYGLGAIGLDAGAVARIYAAKGRPSRNPVILHVASVKAARELAESWPIEAELLSSRFWPGPLTIVVNRRPIVPDIVAAGGPTVALRMPAHPVALGLLTAVGAPVAAPSANRSSRISPTSAAHVLRSLDGRIDLVLDGGSTFGGIESTVIDLSVLPAVILRPGLVSAASIESVIGPVAWKADPASLNLEPLRSPGTIGRHYAPLIPLQSVEGDGRSTAIAATGSGEQVAWLSFGSPQDGIDDRIRVVAMPENASEYAARLYATLYELEQTELDRIIVDLPPDRDEWKGVRDRLLRASMPVDGRGA